jgi:hypothetical protein
MVTTRREELLKHDRSQQRCIEEVIPVLPTPFLDFIPSLAPGACFLDTVSDEIYFKVTYSIDVENKGSRVRL